MKIYSVDSCFFLLTSRVHERKLSAKANCWAVDVRLKVGNQNDHE
jgi:hypothetical protein